MSIAEKLRYLVEQTSITTEQEQLQVTISVGATRVRVGDTLESLVHRADQLMYHSKSEGRNRTSCG